MAELKVGQKAPSFKLPSGEDSSISLKDFAGKTVVLYFYPKDSTPGCTQEACDFRDSAAKFKKKGAVILGVSKDSAASHAKFTKAQGLTFPLLSDTEGEVCEKYGVWQEKKNYGRAYMGILRSTFVIDPQGKLILAEYGIKVKGHVDKVLEII